MKDVSMPKEFVEDFKKWCKANEVPKNAKRNDELYEEYRNAIQVCQSIFGRDMVIFKKPEERLKSYEITIIKSVDITIENKDLQKLFKAIQNAAYIKFGNFVNEANSLDIVYENIYSE